MTSCVENAPCIEQCGASRIDFPVPRALPKLVANSPYLSGYKSLAKRLGKYQGNSGGCVTIAHPKMGQLLSLSVNMHDCQSPFQRRVEIDLSRIVDDACNPDQVGERLYLALMQDPYLPGLIRFNVTPQTSADPATKELTATGLLTIEWEMINPNLGQLSITVTECNTASVQVSGSATPTKTEGFIHGEPAFYYPEMDPSLKSVFPWDCKIAQKLQFAGFVQECQRCQTNTPAAPHVGYHMVDYGYGYVGELSNADCGCACQGCGGGMISILYTGTYTAKIDGVVTPSGSHVLAISEDGRSLTFHKVGANAPKGYFSTGTIVSIVEADGAKVAFRMI